MRRIQVLLVFSTSELGGAERSLTRMALTATDEVEFTLATLDGPGPWSDWCREMGVEPLVLGERMADGGHGRFGFKALQNLLALVRRERYAALYVIGLRASLWLRFMRPWLAGVRLVHGIRWNPDSDSRLDRAFRLIERLLGGVVDLYICNSRVAGLTLERRAGIPQAKIRVVYNGLNQLPPDRILRSTDPLRVLTVANLSPRKGYLEYMEGVVAPLSRSLPSARFVIVGRDEMAGTVQRKSKDLGLHEIVEFSGFLPDVSREFEAARVFVLPSLWNEGCPTSILEAMAHSLPVVAFAIDGIPELIKHQVDGILVSPGNYVGMAKAIAELLANTDWSWRLGQAGRAKVENLFGIEHCANMHTEIFKELLQVGN